MNCDICGRRLRDEPVYFENNPDGGFLAHKACMEWGKTNG